MSKIDSIFYQKLELSPTFEFDIRVVRTQADALDDGFGRYDLHYHSIWEIDYVVSGDGENIFHDSVYPFAPGDIYVIKPYQMHNAYPAGEIELFCIRFSLESVIKSVFSDSDFNDEMTKDVIRFADVIRANDPNYDGVHTIIKKILNEWQSRRVGWHSATRLLLAQLFIELTRNFKAKSGLAFFGSGSDNFGIHRALDYINTNYTQQIRLEQAAQCAIMQKNYFCTQFKKHVGCTYYSYLTSLRIRHACTLLLSTDTNIKKIALSSGFLDISTFNKAFKKTTGVTPKEYRDRNSGYFNS